MQRVILLSVGLVLAAGLAGYAWSQRPIEDPEGYHIHAAFQVYRDNQLQDYSALEFQHIRPCTDQDENPTPEEQQLEKAHLHEMVGDVVHVHREDATWGDLFTNLKVVLPEPITGYINGQPVDDILAASIRAYDRVLILSGDQNTDIETKLQGLPTQEYIQEKEQVIESC